MMSSFRDLTVAVLKEIDEALAGVSPSSVKLAVGEITRARRVFLAGVGRSGAAVRAGAIRLMHLGKHVHLVGDAAAPPVTDADLLLIGSASGRAETLLDIARKAKKVGCRFLLVTADPESPLARLADSVVQIPSPWPANASAGEASTPLQPLGNLFEQSLYILLDLFIIIMMEDLGVSADEMLARHANLE